MSYVRCPVCGNVLASDAVICNSCGKVVRRSSQPQAPVRPVRPARGQTRRTAPPQQGQVRRTVQPQQGVRRPQQQRQAAPRPQPQRQAAPRPQPRPRPVYDAPPAAVQAEEARGRFRRRGVSGKAVIIARIVCLLLLMAVIYLAGYLIQTTRVKASSYPFKSSMKMTYSSYGRAIDNYFEDGHWSVNLFTGSCTYSGTTKHGEELELRFRAGLKVTLTEIISDGKKVDKDKMESKVMGMFI